MGQVCVKHIINSRTSLHDDDIENNILVITTTAIYDIIQKPLISKDYYIKTIQRLGTQTKKNIKNGCNESQMSRIIWRDLHECDYL